MDTSTYLAVALGLFVIFILQKLLRKGKTPPGPVGFPVVGYIPFLSRKPYLDFQKLAKKYGNVFSVQMGSKYVVILNDFENTKDVFAQDVFIGRPPESPFDLNKETIETGAFFGQAWKEQRRFSLHTLKDLGLGRSKMEGRIQEEIRHLLEHLERETNKPYCAYKLLGPSMSNNIGSLVFGRRFDYDDPVRQMMSRVLNNIGRAAGQIAWRLFFPWLGKILQLFGTVSIKEVQKELRDYIIKEMNEHEQSLNPQNIRDFIDSYLLEIKRRQGDSAFSKPVLQDLVGAFFGAGSETVRLSVEWLLLTAAHYQKVQRRIQSEIDEVIGMNRLPVSTDQKVMPYIEACITELMRWRTIIPLSFMRYNSADAEIGGYHIPKHSCIISNSWAIHHDREYWGADADEYRPERFLTEDSKEVKKWERYIPFSIGKRACPGEPFAKIEIFLYFTSILQRFNVRLPDGKVADFEGDLGIGLIPKPQELIFTKRN